MIDEGCRSVPAVDGRGGDNDSHFGDNRPNAINKNHLHARNENINGDILQMEPYVIHDFRPRLHSKKNLV